MAEPYRVLSIDGGGIRGLIPAKLLAEIERRTGKPVSELFDLVAGTSTGGILALALAMPAEGAPAWSAQELIGLYEREGPDIFSRSLRHRIRSADGLLDERYPADGLERALDTYFGTARLSEALTEVVVTAYDIERRTPFFFKRRNAREDAAVDFQMRAAARATSAAPTYFEPVKLERPAGAAYLPLVDGGVFANNPAMCAFAEARRWRPEAEVLIVSLGTGELTKPLPYDDAKDWGLAEWAKPILDVVFDGVSDTVDYQLRQMLEDDRYFRFQTLLDKADDDLDNANEDNLQRLKQEAEELISAEEARIEQVCELLTTAL